MLKSVRAEQKQGASGGGQTSFCKFKRKKNGEYTDKNEQTSLNILYVPMNV